MLETSGRPANVLRSVLLSVGVLAVGAGVGGTLLALRVEPARRDNPALPPLVDTLTVATEDVVEHFIGYGTVRSARTAKVAAEVAANVTARGEGVREGSVVHEGQVLVHLDDQAYRHALERARAQAAAEAAALEELEAEVGSLQDLIETAQRELRVAANERDRVTALFEGDLAAKKELDEARQAYDRANRVLQGFLRQTALLAPRRKRLEASKRALEAEAALAELNTERCRIVAPFDGRIERLDVDEGDRVSPGWVVAVLIDPDRVEIPLRLPALVYDHISVGAPCRMESESRPGVFWTGEVMRLGPTADKQTRTFAAYVEVDNTVQAQPLVPGLFVQARVGGELLRDRILLPRSACRDGRVLVVEAGVARARSVDVDRFIDDRALVQGDLKTGDRVILSHLSQLLDGSPVRLRSAQEPQGAPDASSGGGAENPAPVAASPPSGVSRRSP